MTGELCLWRPNSGRGWRISGYVTVTIGRYLIVIRIGPVPWIGDKKSPTVMTVVTMTKVIAGYRATAMLDGECTRRSLTCTESHNQNRSESQDLARTYLKIA